MTDLILGTAGHIDHGKTSLVRALTGVDTDRLPEEKRRGITIELGFAELVLGEYRLGIVDVPGHERFVRNMLAGATGVDLALLVVAADDSIKPQTREHLEILRLLKLEAGVIVIAKCDLVEPGWLGLVEDEIRELVSGTFLANAPFVRTSVVTGQGLDELRRQLSNAASYVAERRRVPSASGPFRMAIDRMFTMAGHGTIVTGSVSSGSVTVGGQLWIEPGGIRTRVRGLQNHDRVVEEVHRGQRAAINLAGVHHESLERGQELCSPGHLLPSRVLTVRLHLSPNLDRPCKNRSRVRLHVGTAEIPATLRLLHTDCLAPGETAEAQLFLARPAVTIWNQPFVIRSESPVVTIGGGCVLDPTAERIRSTDSETGTWVKRLCSADMYERSSAALYFAGLRDWTPQDLARTAGVSDAGAAEAALRGSGDLVETAVSPTRTFRVHRRVLTRLGQRIENTLRKLHERHPLRLSHDRALLLSTFRDISEPAVVRAALESLESAGKVISTEKGVALVGYGPRLTQNERKVLSQLLEVFRTGGIHTPTVSECQQLSGRSAASVPQLLSLAVESGELVEVATGYYLHAEVVRDVQQRLAAQMAASEGWTLSQIRELLQTTRKYAVPLCEFFDRVGFTTRRGDLRVLADSVAK